MENENRITALIEQGCSFSGDLSFTGTVRISGEISGTIFTNDRLIILEDAIVNADINAGVVIISGNVKGKIRASSRVEIKKPARFEGSVVAPSLIVEEGVIFHGETKIKDH
jgi:cytoskeletal protein CcmA (bactofilin family)